MYKGQRYAFWVTVIRGLFTQNLLGRSVAKRIGPVMTLHAVNAEVFSDVFGDIGLLNSKPVKTELKLDAEPYVIATPHSLPFPLLPKAKAELKRMLALGVI